MICRAVTEICDYDAIVIPVEENKGILCKIPEILEEAVTLAAENFKGKKSETKILTMPLNGKLVSVILIGLGNGLGLPKEQFLAFAHSCQKLKELKSEKAVVFMDGISFDKEKAVEAFYLANYSFNKFKSKPVESSLKEIAFLCTDDAENMQKAVTEAENCAAGIYKTRDVVNTPAMEMTPEKFAAEAVQAGKDCGFCVKILGKNEIIEQKMGAFLAVAKGSAYEPKLIVMEYKGAENDEISLALVGKGIMFDSGGFNLKSSMTYAYTDMAGGGAVLGTMIAAAKNKLKVNLCGIVPACQNILSKDAYLPGDIVQAMNGKMVEIDNTDAEGRMVLADAITYAFEVCKAKKVVDIATLTGAVRIALGKTTAAFMTNDDEIRNSIVKASKKSCEKMWELPLDDELMPSLSSHIADIKNSVGATNMGGGSIVGGLFLQEFTGGKPWAHLDIAAVSGCEGGYIPTTAKGSTGFGVSLMYNLAKQLEV